MTQGIPSPKRIPPTPWGMLPPRLKVLVVSDSENVGWLSEALGSDRICTVEHTIAASVVEAFEAICESAFDCLLIVHKGSQTIDAVAELKTATQSKLPILVIGNLADREFSALCFEAGADGFLAIDTITIRELIWHIARATERSAILEENERLRATERSSTEKMHEQVMRLIGEQRAAIGCENAVVTGSRSEWLRGALEQLLTTFATNPGEQMDGEFQQFCDEIRQAGIGDLAVVDTILQIMASSASKLGPKHSHTVFELGSVLIFEFMRRMSTSIRLHAA